MTSTKFIVGMRDAYFDELYTIFEQDKSAVFITADNGAPTLDRFASDFPGQYYTVGIAEQQLIGMACGMAFEGRKVYTYAIAPFVTTRVFEQLKLDVCAMNLPIVTLGVGAGYAYDIMGPTHHTVEDLSIIRVLPNMVIHSPADSITAGRLAAISHNDASPQYIRFDRTGIPNLYEDMDVDIAAGVIETRPGKDVVIISTGVMVHEALKAADILAGQGIDTGVIDICRVKPLNEELLFKYLDGIERVITLEEHLLAGGLGSAILETLVDNDQYRPTLRIGQRDRFVFDLGGREVIWKKYGLDAESVAQRAAEWLGG